MDIEVNKLEKIKSNKPETKALEYSSIDIDGHSSAATVDAVAK